jgi:hypothetical protein
VATNAANETRGEAPMTIFQAFLLGGVAVLMPSSAVLTLLLYREGLFDKSRS